MTAFLFAAVGVLAMSAASGGALDAELSDGKGKEVRLSAFRGRPTILFYEDRDSTPLNQGLKDELFRRGREEGLLNDVAVVAVANVAGYNWFPAKRFAQSGIRQASKRFGVPVLADWTGTLRKAPWNLPDKTSTVVVLTPVGEEAFRASGALGPETSEQIFDTVRGLLPTREP